MRLIFMGTPDFAVPALKALIADGRDVVAVYTQPPRPAGRGKKLMKSPVHLVAEEAGIPVETPVDFKAQPEIDRFAAYRPKLAVVAAYGLILPQALLGVPDHGCLNIHASLLPRWRGAAPIHRAIEAGDKETGVGLMQMEAGLDTGPVFAESRMVITNSDTTGTLHDSLAESGAQLLLDHIDAIAGGAITATPQGSAGITYAHKITKEEALIDWSKPAEDIGRHVRAMNPFPGAFTFKGEDRLRLVAGTPDMTVDHGEAPGTVLSEDGLIACGIGTYQLTRLQRAGKGAADIDAFLRGYAINKGEKLVGSNPNDPVSLKGRH